MFYHSSLCVDMCLCCSALPEILMKSDMTNRCLIWWLFFYVIFYLTEKFTVYPLLFFSSFIVCYSELISITK